MYLIEIFLPLADNEGKAFTQSAFEAVEKELVERFGGVTSYPRAPASGLWKDSAAAKVQDDLLVYEVMAEELDQNWWSRYRERLERSFRQEKLVVRSQEIQLL
jgi:hypothetical protein